MTHRFKNLDGSGPHPFSSVLKWGVVDKLAGRRRKSPAQAPVPRVEPDLATLATPPAPGEAQQRKALQPQRSHHRFQVCYLGGQGKFCNFPI